MLLWTVVRIPLDALDGLRELEGLEIPNVASLALYSTDPSGSSRHVQMQSHCGFISRWLQCRSIPGGVALRALESGQIRKTHTSHTRPACSGARATLLALRHACSANMYYAGVELSLCALPWTRSASSYQLEQRRRARATVFVTAV